MHEVFFFVYAKNVKCKNEGVFRGKGHDTEWVFPQEFAHGNSNVSINEELGAHQLKYIQKNHFHLLISACALP